MFKLCVLLCWTATYYFSSREAIIFQFAQIRNDGRSPLIAATYESMEDRHCVHTVTKKQANKPQSAAGWIHNTTMAGSALHSNQPRHFWHLNMLRNPQYCRAVVCRIKRLAVRRMLVIMAALGDREVMMTILGGSISISYKIFWYLSIT